MKIKVIGSGCQTCKKLYELAKQAASELGIKDAVEYSTDTSEIIAMGLMQSPILTTHGKPALIGKPFDALKVREVIQLHICKQL